MSSEQRDRALVGIVVLFLLLAFAAVYLLVASVMFDAFEHSPITNDPGFNGFIEGDKVWPTIKDVGLIYVPLIIAASGVVFAVGYYIRKERFGGRRPPP